MSTSAPSEAPIYLLWTDLETTGLDEKRDRILEVAWAITDLDLELVGEPKVHLIGQDDWLDFFNYWRNDVDRVVQDMHQENGLFEAIQEEGVSNLDRAYLDLRQDLEAIYERYPNAEVHLAGRSVHFDRGFLLANEFDSLFYARGTERKPLISHRVLDVRSIRTFLENMGGLTIPVAPPQGPEHRALSDVMGDIRLLKGARALLLTAFPHPPVMVKESPADPIYLIG
jgi:oligoribonuclease (3'-5' exoribonuclease)